MWRTLKTLVYCWILSSIEYSPATGLDHITEFQKEFKAGADTNVGTPAVCEVNRQLKLVLCD